MTSTPLDLPAGAGAGPHPVWRRGLGPALLASAVAAGLVAARVAYSDRASFAFLPWNLALAWVPYAATLAGDAATRRGARWLVPPLGALWLLFLPNAPYLLTDFVHLKARAPVPVWFDIALLAVFAATGWLLGLLSLEAWRERWAARLGRAGAWACVAGVSVLCGYGVYVGRVLRWNSWDVWSAPGRVLGEALGHVRAPLAQPGLVLLTGVFAALLLGSAALFAHLVTGPSPSEG